MASIVNVFKPSACFEVQKIVGISINNGSSKVYKVQWAPSWISGFHLVGCEDLIEQFEHEQKNNEVDIKVETVDECATPDGSGVVFDEKVFDEKDNDDVMQDADQPDDSREQQLPDSHSNVDVNVEVSETALDTYHINQLSYIYTKDEDYNSDANVRVVSSNSTFQNKDQANKQLLCRNIPNSDLQYFQNDISKDDGSSKDYTISVVGQAKEHGQCDGSQLPEPVTYFNKGVPVDMVIPETNLTNITNDVTSKGECILFSFQSDQLITDGVRETNHPDSTNINTIPATSETICYSTHGHKFPQPTTYFNQEGRIHMVAPEPISQHEITKVNSKKKTLICNICDKTFSSYYKRKIHYKMHSAGINIDLYECHICTKTFSDSEMLHDHLRRHSINAKLGRFKCTICAKAFKKSYDLVRHTRVHTGERPFQCNVCQRRFKVKQALNCHLKTQHFQEQNTLVK